MTLFDKNKQQSPSSSPDLSGIKQEASNSSSSNTSNQLPSFNSNPTNQNNNQMNNGINNEFVNPFNSNQNSNPTMGNSMNMNSYQSPSSSSPSFGQEQQQMPSFDSSTQYPSSMGGGFPQQSSPNVASLNSGDFISKEQAEEIIVQTVETILEDKWEDITRNVRKVVEWKDKVESQITLVKEDIVSLQDAFTTLEKRLISKLNNYDKSILDVGSEIKALDKVFQKITPTLVNNVTELGRIAKDLKNTSNANRNYEE